jgi:hypothetical protein
VRERLLTIREIKFRYHLEGMQRYLGQPGACSGLPERLGAWRRAGLLLYYHLRLASGAERCDPVPARLGPGPRRANGPQCDHPGRRPECPPRR